MKKKTGREADLTQDALKYKPWKFWKGLKSFRWKKSVATLEIFSKVVVKSIYINLFTHLPKSNFESYWAPPYSQPKYVFQNYQEKTHKITISHFVNLRFPSVSMFFKLFVQLAYRIDKTIPTFLTSAPWQ